MEGEEGMKNAEGVITALRMLAVDMVEEANSGHPGMPLGAAPMGYLLFFEFMHHNPSNPQWPNRDRFVLSAGHGSALLYALLYLSGYDLSLDDLRRFRQVGSRTPGHPEYGLTPGVETTTGPLGQGFANGVGMAIAERILEERFNQLEQPLVDHWIYGIVSDGDLMEGISHEAASLAGHLGLGRLIYLYDDNRITIDGSTDLAFSEDVHRRFEAYGWQVLEVDDGNDVEALRQAIEEARQDVAHPSLIRVRTHIGYGSPLQDTAKVHGSPLGVQAWEKTREFYGWPKKRFWIPEDVEKIRETMRQRGQALEDAWKKILAAYTQKNPELVEEFQRWLDRELPPNLESYLPHFEPGKALATRAASGEVINALATVIPNLIGGSADLTDSNKTRIRGSSSLSRESFKGRNIHFGVREHAMGGILNGMAYYGGLFPFGGTFLVFSDYMRPAIRIAALSHLHVVYVFSHDSVWLGEDGPTHQPVEHLASLRTIPRLVVIRPADANETGWAWVWALRHRKGPVALALSRQAVPVLDRSRYAEARGLLRGAYILARNDQKPRLVLIGTGSEVALVIQAYEVLKREIPIQVVSFPSWEIFSLQDRAYQEEVLPPGVPKLVVEAGVLMGWDRWVDRGKILGLDRFGASGPYKELMRHFGFTVERIVEEARRLVDE